MLNIRRLFLSMALPAGLTLTMLAVACGTSPEDGPTGEDTPAPAAVDADRPAEEGSRYSVAAANPEQTADAQADAEAQEPVEAPVDEPPAEVEGSPEEQDAAAARDAEAEAEAEAAAAEAAAREAAEAAAREAAETAAREAAEAAAREAAEAAAREAAEAAAAQDDDQDEPATLPPAEEDDEEPQDEGERLAPLFFAADELIDVEPAVVFIRADGSGADVWHLPNALPEFAVSPSGSYFLWLEKDATTAERWLHLVQRSNGIDRVLPVDDHIKDQYLPSAILGFGRDGVGVILQSGTGVLVFSETGDLIRMFEGALTVYEADSLQVLDGNIEVIEAFPVETVWGSSNVCGSHDERFSPLAPGQEIMLNFSGDGGAQVELWNQGLLLRTLAELRSFHWVHDPNGLGVMTWLTTGEEVVYSTPREGHGGCLD